MKSNNHLLNEPSRGLFGDRLWLLGLDEEQLAFEGEGDDETDGVLLDWLETDSERFALCASVLGPSRISSAGFMYVQRPFNC